MTHDYKRNGTVDLFAAMDIATGQVLTGVQKPNAATDVLAPPNRSMRPTPEASPCSRVRQPVRTQRAGDHRMAGAPRPPPLAPCTPLRPPARG
jgi:hypothetical protein